MSDEKEFRPLGAEHLPSRSPAPPVNWFTHVAPRLPENVPVVPVEPVTRQSLGSRGARSANFEDVALVARREQQARLQPLPEPPELILMRQTAKAEAKALLQTAREEAEAIAEQARQQGYAVGHAQGMENGRREATRHVLQQHADERVVWSTDLAAFVAHIEAERQRVWAAMEPQIVRMVFELAKKIIKQEVTATRDVALAVVENALRRVVDSGGLRVRVSPTDLEAVREHREELLGLVDGLRHIEIVDDRRVGPGGCIVETNSGNIDARIETQLDDTAKLMDLT